MIRNNQQACCLVLKYSILDSNGEMFCLNSAPVLALFKINESCHINVA